MHEPEITLPDYPVLAVAYDDKSRAALAASTEPFGVRTVSCASFGEAQSYALSGCCQGVLVDLATMIKAKDEERVAAHTLTGLYPTLRVKTMGSMLIPMIMSGDAKQDKSLRDFLTKTCLEFTPRKLRSSKRRNVCVPAYVGTERGFTVDISWSGAFIATMNPERYLPGGEGAVTLLFDHDSELSVEVIVARVQVWGERRPPGIGVQFKQLGQELERSLFALLRSDKDNDRDRLVA
jgi:hypothetical protein